MNNKYESFLRILDGIIDSAPKSKYQKRYSKKTDDELNYSRSRAFLHLYLMANFGMMSFEEREKLVTDGSQDGGIDAYYFDSEHKIKYYIQAKFRASSHNFSEKEIELPELTAMQIRRIEAGERYDENGKEYNGKVKGLQDALSGLKHPGSYDTRVILLANTTLDNSVLRKLTGGYDVDVFNNEAVYSKLVYPVVSGNYFNSEELEISINLANAEHPRITYKVDLGSQSCNITVLFAPTIEIAKILDRYKNSVLKYNPRSYLNLKGNKVNKSIMSTLLESKNNEFALFNNGLTIVAESCDFAERTGRYNVAKLTLKSPQIINGGQTAFTLSQAYSEYKNDKDKLKEIFEKKEVLVKIVSFVGSSFDVYEEECDEEDDILAFTEDQLKIIERVSASTNHQSPIKDADGKANDEIQVKFQSYVYKNFGYYYERKRGEFVEGLRRKYIDSDLLIKRDDLVRCCLASESKPGEARRANQNYLFKKNVVDYYLSKPESYDIYVKSYEIFNELKSIEKEYRTTSDKYAEVKFGSALRYGKYAVVSSVILSFDSAVDVRRNIMNVLTQWKDFEADMKKLESNSQFFKSDENMLNYYKSSRVNVDVVGKFDQL